MNALFLNLVAIAFLLAGPILGYRIAKRGEAPRRWQVVGYAAAGGAAAAVLLMGVLLLTELASYRSVLDLLRDAARLVGAYALVGLVLGIAAVITPEKWRHRLFVSGMMIVGLSSLVAVGIQAATISLDKEGVTGVVFGPGNRPAVGAPVFVDRDFGAVERLTTDTAGRFHALLDPRGSRPPILLICVPGGIPQLSRPIDKTLNAYSIRALPRRGRGQSHLRREGWRAPIPRECQVDSTR